MQLFTNTNQQEFDILKNIITEKYPNLENENIKAFFLKKLKPADIIKQNKSDSNKTTHIACTGPSRYFFYEAYGEAIINDYSKEDLTRTIPVFVESRYTNTNSSENFVLSSCAIWCFPKKEGNQIGLSKVSLDGEEFKELRSNIYEGDVLVFFKYVSSEKQLNIFTLLLKNKEDSSAIDSLNIGNPKYWEDVTNTNILLDSDQSIYFNPLSNNSSSSIIGINKIFLGAPGTGKSHYVHENYYINKKAKRVTFHPEYTYYDFVGSIKPFKNENQLSYEFVPGIFTEILTEAFKSPNTEFNLIIEELNRANTAAVFGDLFQLLDRNSNGSSEYPVNNREVLEYINKQNSSNLKELIIPNNLNIIATMNSSDQNIFIMDTAFKRRWDIEYIPIKFEANHKFKDTSIPGLKISWKTFVTSINNFMLSSTNSDLMISEDKQLGPYFIKEHEIQDKHKFAYKVFLYLWDDVFKIDRYRIFNPNIRSFSSIIETFDKSPLEVFNPKIKNIFEPNFSDVEGN